MEDGRSAPVALELQLELDQTDGRRPTDRLLFCM